MGRAAGSDLIATFQAFYDDLHRIVTAHTGDVDRAADIVQDTYFRVASVQAMGTQIDNPRAYVMKVARNLATDDGRRLSRNIRYNGSDEEALAVSDPAPLPDAALLAKERLRLLDSALHELPSRARQALLLSRIEGLSQREIAKRLGVSESQISQDIARALKHCMAWRRRTGS